MSKIEIFLFQKVAGGFIFFISPLFGEDEPILTGLEPPTRKTAS